MTTDQLISHFYGEFQYVVMINSNDIELVGDTAGKENLIANIEYLILALHHLKKRLKQKTVKKRGANVPR